MSCYSLHSYVTYLATGMWMHVWQSAVATRRSVNQRGAVYVYCLGVYNMLSSLCWSPCTDVHAQMFYQLRLTHAES